MNCTIPAGNLKVLTKSLQTLSKIGDELYIEVTKESLLFRSINANKTAFCSFKFFNTFFTSFEVADIDSESDENPKLARKIQMKAILAIFKPLHKDKNLAFCHVELQYESIVIIFKIQYKFDVTVLHKVHLLDMEFWQVNYPNDSMNQVTGTGHCFSQVLSNFQLNNDDLGLEVMHHKVVMRNYDMRQMY
ncbi:cell cycle checkpoint control protein RAD9A isoform X4 [Agrilus planipennis]|uniref:Cell cycle checkpoint control protein RAD9A isoform X4 n=1 Tax=Agrilus planipennis TaxID=224129 RepID=A0A7F5RNR0_AGRPL|nr:cell cycle checkpoint control protein RAD9A isoform X4 [Agrilus planipennis]